MLPAGLALAALLLLNGRGAAEDGPSAPSTPATGAAVSDPARPTAASKAQGGARALRRKLMERWLLQYFNIGVEAPVEWHLEVAAQGARFGANAMYISGSAKEGTAGEDQYYFKYNALENHILDAQKAGQVCWSTYYVLAQSSPALYKPGPAQATPVNAKVPGTMRSYWEIFKHCLQIMGAHPEVPCVLQIEPDEWGHLLIAAKMDPNASGIVMVGSSGMPELAGQPDTVAGWAEGFRILRDKYAPEVILCANPSAWDGEGAMSAKKWCEYFDACKVNPAGGWDMFVAQENDWDHGLKSNGGNAKWPPYSEKDLVAYGHSWKWSCAWIRGIHEGTGMWCAMWQLPVGNCTYATCDGSDGHGCDGYAEALLDTYPKDGLLQAMAASGCCMWIFSHGGGGASVWDAKKDGITNPPPIPGNKGKKSAWPDDDGGYLRVKGALYYKKPWPILGKAKPATDEQPKPEAPVVTYTLSDQDALARYGERLQKRIAEELAARRLIKITSSLLQSTIRIDAIADGQLQVVTDQGGQMTLAWTSLSRADLTQLAQLQVRTANPGDHAILGFYLLAAGDAVKADAALQEAGPEADEVRKAFTKK